MIWGYHNFRKHPSASLSYPDNWQLQAKQALITSYAAVLLYLEKPQYLALTTSRLIWGIRCLLVSLFHLISDSKILG